MCEGLGGVGGLRIAVCRRRAGGWFLSRRQEQSLDTSSHTQMQHACVDAWKELIHSRRWSSPEKAE